MHTVFKLLQTVGASASLVVILMSAPAMAHGGTADEQAACTPDVFRLCAAEIPYEDKIVACLNRKLNKLSPACKAVMTGSEPETGRRKRAND